MCKVYHVLYKLLITEMILYFYMFAGFKQIYRALCAFQFYFNPFHLFMHFVLQYQIFDSTSGEVGGKTNDTERYIMIFLNRNIKYFVYIYICPTRWSRRKKTYDEHMIWYIEYGILRDILYHVTFNLFL